jgi:hypothetical protein
MGDAEVFGVGVVCLFSFDAVRAASTGKTDPSLPSFSLSLSLSLSHTHTRTPMTFVSCFSLGAGLGRGVFVEFVEGGLERGRLVGHRVVRPRQSW